jgi:adenine-specific DNA-methyltransferase
MANRSSIPISIPSFKNDRLNDLKSTFPDAFSEGKVDFEKLRAALGDLVDDAPERYTFSWAGKRDAIRLLQTPTRATLVPAPEESVDFEGTHNLFIEGDNLEVLKLLYKPYFGRVKMIYIDPPYNTGNDFIYPDDYRDPLSQYLELTGQQDAEGNLLTSNPETSGRYHSVWLSMMYPRLFLSRQLLREDGAIFISVDDHEVHNLRMLMNEVFGEENFVADIIWQKKYSPQNDAKWLSDMHDYIMLYARNKDVWRPIPLPRTREQDAAYKNPDNDKRGPWKATDSTSNKTREQRPNLYYPMINPITGEHVYPPGTRVWAVSKDLYEEMEKDERIWWGENGSNSVPAFKTFLSEVKQGRVPTTLWTYKEVGHNQLGRQELNELLGNSGFDTPKPASLLRRILQISTSPFDSDLVVDFFAGSATTAQAVFEQNRDDDGNRKFILIQLPEPTNNSEFPTIANIGKERIRRVVAKLQVPQENRDQIALPLEHRQTPEDLGFRVFKLAPSHFKPWVGVEEKDAQAYAQQMELFRDPLVDGWTVEGVLAELAIKNGFGLDYMVELRTFRKPGSDEQSVDFYQVRDNDRGQTFYVCLAPRLSLKAVELLQLEPEDLFICRDAALDDDIVANLALQCRLETI